MNKIYLIKSIEDSVYKIGVSKNPNKRLKQHQTGNSSPLVLLFQYETVLSYEIERILHRRYSHFKKEGEWFDLSIKEEVQFISECIRIEKSINDLKIDGNVFI